MILKNFEIVPWKTLKLTTNIPFWSCRWCPYSSRKEIPCTSLWTITIRRCGVWSRTIPGLRTVTRRYPSSSATRTGNGILPSRTAIGVCCDSRGRSYCHRASRAPYTRHRLCMDRPQYRGATTVQPPLWSCRSNQRTPTKNGPNSASLIRQRAYRRPATYPPARS